MGENHHPVTVTSQGSREAGIWELAHRQSGNVTRAQLLDVGLSEGAIDGRLRTGALVYRFRGVYALAPARQDAQALAAAAVLAGGPHAVASHASAAWLWGLVKRWETPPEITLSKGDRRPRGVRTHRCRSLQPPDITRQRGVPTTTPARTILDLAPRLTAKRRTRLVNDALLSRHLRPAALEDVLTRNPTHPATRLLRPFVDDPINPTRSGFEDEFLAFTARYGLPTPQINVNVDGREVDVFFPEQNLIVELDGWEFHNDRAAFEDDRERDAENLKHGRGTLRITRERFEATPGREAARLQEILDRLA